MQRLGALAAIGLLSLPLHAPAFAQQAHATAANTLVVATDISDAKSLDPGRSYEFTGAIVLGGTYDTLVYYKGTDAAHLIGDLASSWSVSSGGAVFTFHLKHGVKFWNGDPLTAADVVFSYNRLDNLKDNPQGLIAGMKSITALDPYMVQITLVAPDVSFLSAITGPNFGIIDSKVAMAQGAVSDVSAVTKDKATTYLNNHSLGSGPYILTSWDPNRQIVMTRNPNYWGTKPAFDKVILQEVKDPATQRLLIASGGADAALGLGFDQINGLQGTPGVGILKASTFDYVYLAMTENAAVSKPMSLLAVQRAVKYAIDYDGMIQGILSGAAVRPATIVPMNYLGSSAAFNTAVRYNTNIKAAKALLSQAGYPNGFTVPFTYPTGFVFDGVNFDLVALKLKSDLSKVGINLTLKPEPISVALADYRAKKTSFGLWPWGADYPDAYDNTSYFGPGGGVGKRIFYNGFAALAKLIATTDAEGDATKRGAMYQQIISDMTKNSPFVVLAQPEKEIAYRTNLHGLLYSPSFGIDFRFSSKS